MDEQGSDVERFRAYVHEVLPRLRGLVRRMGIREQDVDEVCAEALARAWAGWGRVRDHDHPDAWVLRVAANLVVDRWRRPWPVPSGEEASATDDGFDGALVERAVLTEALRRLPRRQREALVLRYLADRPVDEVAGAMGTSVNTAKKHLVRGLAQLRVELAP